MAFGQQSGPPASQKQIAHLKSLLQAVGHDDFRTARHEFGLTQRQAGGKFTTGEATELIDRLESAESTEPQPAPATTATTASRRSKVDDTAGALLRDLPTEVLAEELTRRGWIAMPPP
jgi:hypothetical protein